MNEEIREDAQTTTQEQEIEQAPETTSYDEAHAQAQDQEQDAENQEQEEPSEDVSGEAQRAKTDPKQSWKELREKAERAEQLQKERDEAVGILKQFEDYASNYQKQQQKEPEPQEEDFDWNSINDDDLVEGKYYKKALNKIQQTQKKIEESFAQRQKREQEERIQRELEQKHPDIMQVITAQNLAKLKEQRPFLAKSLAYNPNLEEQAIETYNLIKDLGIYKPSQEQDYSHEDERIAQNKQKPRGSASSVQEGKSPLDNAHAFGRLTPERKQQLFEDMKRKASRR